MKIKNLLTAIAVVVLSTSVGYAQRVVVENGRVIIDASEMPNTTTKKPNKTTATNATSCTQDATDIASAVNNEKVYKKFEVSKVMNRASFTWRDAIDLCANSTTDGGGWRLPTQRELMLMWVLKGELEATNGFEVFSGITYWSATQHNSAQKWCVLFQNGFTGVNSTSPYLVRCIREL